MDVELAITALHEAAHACVAASLGQPVHALTIIPSPGDGIFPGTLGEVHLWPQPQPRASDMYPQSRWVEHAVMVFLAGYVAEGAQSGWTVPVLPPGTPGYDHLTVVKLMRCVSGHDPDGWLEQAPALMAKTARFLSHPAVYDRLVRTASLLLATGSMTSAEFYETVLEGRCGMLHPHRPEARCYLERNGHWIHSFCIRDESGRVVDAESLNPLKTVIGMKESASDATPGLRRLREVNQGGPGYALSRAWRSGAARLASMIPSDLQSMRGLRICGALDELG